MLNQNLNKMNTQTTEQNNNNREINVPKTVQEILNWANKSKYHKIKKTKFRKELKGPEEMVQTLLLEICRICEIDPVYWDDEEEP